MKKIALICWLIGILGTAGAQSVPVLDPSKSADTSFSSLFEEVEIIPLETKRESVFGMVKQLVVTDDYCIVLDPDTDAILFFDKKGRFLAKYKNRQRRYRINFIQLDKAHHALLIFSQNKNYNVAAAKFQAYLSSNLPIEQPQLAKATRLYLDDLAALRSEELKWPVNILANPVLLGNNRLAFSFIRSDIKNKDTAGYQLQIMEDNLVVKNFFPYNHKTDLAFQGRNAWQCRLSTTLNDSILFFTRPSDPVIYSLTPSSISQTYKVVLPDQKKTGMPAGMESFSFFDGGALVVSAPGSGRGSNSTALVFNSNTIGQVFDLNRFFFFGIKQSFSDEYFIYDKNNGSLYNYGQLAPDSSNYMFPLTGTILAFDEKNIYQSWTARSLFRKRKNTGKLKVQYHESLTRFYNTGKETDNPVLIRIRPKENLRSQ